MDFNSILAVVAAVVGGTGGLWALWRIVRPLLPTNAKRDAIVEDLLERLHKQTMKGEPTAPSVPDRAVALQYTEAVLRYMEKHGSKEGIAALVVVLSEIASPTPSKE
jgi:hypothetical protein